LADQNPHRDKTLGVTAMTDALLRELVDRDSFCIETFGSKSSYHLDDSRINVRLFPWSTDRTLFRVLMDNLHPLFCRSNSDAWLYPKGYLPFCFRSASPCVGIVHDTILLWYYDHYRDTRSSLEYMYWLTLLRRSVARFDLILTVSESAKKQILDLCERFSICPPPIKVTYESVRYACEKEVCSKQNYVVHLASNLPHKKTDWLLEIWAHAINSRRELPLLKLVGRVPDSSMPLVQKHPQIERLPFLDEGAYKQLLGQARALILPSEIEGFGLPAVEAYCLGTPVCYVKGTAVDEVLSIPNHTGAFELSDRDSLFIALEEVLDISPESVASARIRLQDLYSAKSFGESVAACLSQLN